MPIIQSAIKRDRQATKRRAYNLDVKTDMRKKTKLVRAQVEAKDTTKASEALVAAIAQIDKAAKRGVIHKNTAARRKSQLSLAYNSIAKQAYGTGPAKAKSPAKASPKAVAKKAAPKAAAKKSPTPKK